MRTVRGLCCAAAVLAACGNKTSTDDAAPPPPPVRGLDGLPADAEIIAGAELTALRASEPAQRIARRLGLELDVLPACAEPPARVVIARGASGAVVVGAGGAWAEEALVRCLGAVPAPAHHRRAVYRADSAAGAPVWFAFGAPDWVIGATSEDELRGVLAGTQRLQLDPAVRALVTEPGRDVLAWAIAVRGTVVDGVEPVAGVRPRALYGYLRRAGDGGVELEVGALLASEADAAALHEFVLSQRNQAIIIAQGRGLGPWAGAVEVRAEGDRVRLTSRLTAGDVEQIISRIDRGAGPEQDTPSNQPR